MNTPTDPNRNESTIKAPTSDFGSTTWKFGNVLVGALARAGLGPIHLLVTTGRRTGRPRTTPVVPVSYDGRDWLVAPYGVVSWVHNVRTSASVRMRYGRKNGTYTVREVPPAEAGPVLKRYVAVATKTRTHFRATVDSPVECFTAEAVEHPVFELIPTTEP